MAKHPSWQLTRAQRVTYSVGMFSSAIVTATIMQWILYFYSPPPDQVDTGMVFLAVGIAVGVARLIGAAVDALSNPLVAFWSDKSTNPRGRRTPFIRRGAIPLMILAILVWFPPVRGTSIWNVVWLTLTLSGTWFFYTYVVAPYLALMPEITTDPEERVALTVSMSYWEVGATLIAAIPVPLLIASMKGGVQIGPIFLADGFKFTAIALALLGGIGFFVSVSRIRERPLPKDSVTTFSLVRSVIECFRNPAFPPYLIAVAIAKVAIGIMMISLPFFATAVLKKGEDFMPVLFLPLFIATAIGFWVGGIIVNRVGLKRAFRAATLVGVVVFVGFFGVWFLRGKAEPLTHFARTAGGDVVLAFGDASAATPAPATGERFTRTGSGLRAQLTGPEWRALFEQADVDAFHEAVAQMDDAAAAALLRPDRAEERDMPQGARAWLAEQGLDSLLAHLTPAGADRLFTGPKRRFDDDLAFVAPTLAADPVPGQPLHLTLWFGRVPAPEETFNIEGWSLLFSSEDERRALAPQRRAELGQLERVDLVGDLVFADGSVIFQGFRAADPAAAHAAVAALSHEADGFGDLEAWLTDGARVDHVLARFDLRVEVGWGAGIYLTLLVCFLLGFPAAILMSMYRPIVCEIVDEDERRVGYRREAMYFGVEGLLTKFADGIAGIVVPAVVLVGHLVAAPPFGYVLTFGVGALFMLAAWWVFRWYPLGQATCPVQAPPSGGSAADAPPQA